jgi:hypothetical protein
MSKRGSKENPIKLGDVQRGLKKVLDGMAADERQLSITKAALKEEICNYSYEVLQGVGEGATHDVKGPGLVKDELTEAFVKFNVRLAALDEVFKHSSIEIDDIDKFHVHDLTYKYHVNSFEIKGSSDKESIVLKGYKYTAQGQVELKTPKIILDNLAGYKWYNELKTAADEARRQVKKYHEGNYEPIEKDIEVDLKEAKRQGKLFAKEEEQQVDQDFENAKV